MQIQSSRFGVIEVQDDAVLTLPEGLVGLPGTRYALLTQKEESPFLWFHCVDYGDTAVPVTTPWLFFPQYEVRLSDDDAYRLELEDAGQIDVFCIVRAAEALGDFTINLLSPVVVNGAKRIARQVINECGGYSVREPLFAEVDLKHAGEAMPHASVAAEAS